MGSDDAAYGHALREDAGTLEVHRIGGHVDVFETGAGVEENNLVGGLEVAGGDKGVIGCGGGGAFGREEDAFVLGPIEDAVEDLFVRESEGCAAGLANDVEDDGVAVGLGDAEAGSEGGCVLEELAG